MVDERVLSLGDVMHDEVCGFDLKVKKKKGRV